MTTPRRGFEVPHGNLMEQDGAPTRAMTEYMDTVTKALTILKDTADGVTELDPSSATASDCANVLEQWRAGLQGII